jgi:hypothetical protein
MIKNKDQFKIYLILNDEIEKNKQFFLKSNYEDLKNK